jgi:hypothetical protein
VFGGELIDQNAIAVELQGGLGNQLFGFAVGFAQAHRLEADLLLQFETDKHGDGRAFELERFIGNGVSYGAIPNATAVFREASFAYDPQVEGVGKGTVLQGYFQSWKYFSGVAPLVRASILSASAAVTVNGSSRPPEPFIALQVRRGDYLLSRTAAFHGLCGFEYFARGLDLMRRRVGDLPARVFSDDAHVAREFADQFTNCSADEPSPDEPALETLIRLSGASGFVISNSSFGWWGAWLAGDGIHCIAPDPWFAKKHIDTSDLLPESWIKLNHGP